jgi:NAD-dependent DNA ligase
MGRLKLTDIPGVGPHTARVLAENGIDSVEKLNALPVETLATVPGFGLVRAASIASAAADLQAPAADRSKKKRKKKKDKRKGKGKKKKKKSDGKTNKDKKKKDKKRK